MDLEGYFKEFKMFPGNEQQSFWYVFAQTFGDISPALPHLHRELGSGRYRPRPATLWFSTQGILARIDARTLVLSGAKDPAEALDMVDLIQNRIICALENPLPAAPLPQTGSSASISGLLAFLPQTNCGKCGNFSCTRFALRLHEGEASPDNCPELFPECLGPLCGHLPAISPGPPKAQGMLPFTR